MSVEIISFRPVVKNSLRGFFTVRAFSGVLEIRDCALNETDGREWIGLPARPYEKDDGTKAWSAIIRFPEKRYYEQFCAACLDALTEYRRQRPVGRDDAQF